MQTAKKLETQKNFPAEWEKHKAMWTCWPSDPEQWLEDLEPARMEVAGMVKALAEGDSVKVLVNNSDSEKTAKQMLGSAAEVISAPYGDIWLRDTGPIFVKDAHGAALALRFKTNGWGGKYDMPDDQIVGDKVAEFSGTPIERVNFILEGGSVDSDGNGLILTTRQCVLNPNRNKGWTEEIATQQLLEAFGAQKILWLGDGMLNDHTDGHIDNIARFYAPGKVVCQKSAGADDPNTEIFEQIASDLRGYGLDVVQVISPGRFLNYDDIAIPASHMNFIIGNETVVVPTYDTPSAQEAVAAIQELFPKHKVVGSPSMSVLKNGGGSFHCTTQQEPV